MSNTEKIIGIVAVIGICGIAAIAIIIAAAYLGRWRAKGIRPGVKFAHNPNALPLTVEQQRAINIGAILAESNNDFCDSLATSKTMAKKTIKAILANDWQIKDTKSALFRLDELLFSGHRKMCNYILKHAEILLASTESKSPREIYEEVGTVLLDSRILEDYPKEVALFIKHIDFMDVILKASTMDELKEYQTMFGDEKTLLICLRIFQEYYEQCQVYENRIKNLKDTIADLQKNGYLGAHLKELEQIDATAWDMGRMVNVARYSYDLEYITEEEAWEYITYAFQESASCYNSFEEFGQAYIIARAMWAGQNTNLYGAMSTLELLINDENSPWKLAPLHASPVN